MSDFNNQIEQLVNDAMSRQLKAKNEPVQNLLFESIEDYQTSTGKRFRMTKDQVNRKISREEAFVEFMQRFSK